MGFTKEQEIAVMADEGNWLINAGAGSGKTTSFTARIARLVKKDIALPEEILGLTFTKESANSMQKKLGKLIGKKQASNVHLSTFHSFAYNILHQKYPGKYKSLELMPSWWKMKTLNNFCSKASGFNPDGMNLNVKAGDLASFISYQKMNMIAPGEQIVTDLRTQTVNHIEESTLSEIYSKYCHLQEKARLMEFDDMLLDLYNLLQEDERLGRTIRDRYDYIMVDEFQDTNKVSMGILQRISDNNLFAVGDFRQGIYGFINASIDNILDFTDVFEDVHVVDLKHNFRSTRNIVAISNKIIDKSPIEKYKQFAPQLAASKEVGDSIKLAVYRDEQYETREIAVKISEMVESGKYDFCDFAVLLRTNAQLGMYESAFSSQEIPVDVSSDKSFFDRREIADLLSYAEHTIDPDNDNSFRKVYNSPNRFVSHAVQKNIDEYSHKHDISLEDAAMKTDNGRSAKAIAGFVNLFDDLRNIADDMRADKFLIEIYKRTGFKTHLEKTAATAVDLETRIEAVDSLFKIAKKFSHISHFLAHILVIKQNNKKKKNENAVRLMTLHAAKGLEFNYVFMPSFTDESYPHNMNPDEEEERRLAYVGLSRSRNGLELSMPNFVTDGGLKHNPSPFLIDVVGDDIADLQKEVTRGENEAKKELYFV